MTYTFYFRFIVCIYMNNIYVRASGERNVREKDEWYETYSNWKYREDSFTFDLNK